MCAMIGASRILHALALDDLFGRFYSYISAFFLVHKLFFSETLVFFAGLPLAPAAVTSSSGNPWVAVLYTWGLAQVGFCGVCGCVFSELQQHVLSCGLWCVFVFQCVVFAGQLNSIASLVTVFYLLAYAAVDLACLALEWASAPNFR